MVQELIAFESESMNLKNSERIKKIKKNYRLQIKKLYSLPNETYKTFGEPIAIECAEDCFFILYMKWPSCLCKVIKYSIDFKENWVLLEDSNIVDICYLNQKKELRVARASYLDLYTHNFDTAFNSLLNGIIRCDLAGNSEEILTNSTVEPFFPLRLCNKQSGNIVVYKMNTGQLITLNENSQIIETIEIGMKFLRKLKSANSDEIYFYSSPRIGKNIFNKNDNFERLYKINSAGQLQSVYQKVSQAVSPIFDFEVGTDWLLIAQADGLVKITIAGEIIFRVSQSDPRWGGIHHTGFRILYLRRDVQDENRIYCLSEDLTRKKYDLFQIEI